MAQGAYEESDSALLSPIESELARLTEAGPDALESALGPATERRHYVDTPSGPLHVTQVYNALRRIQGSPRRDLDLAHMDAAEIDAILETVRAEGFEIRPYVLLSPPEIHQTFANRTAIMEEYGGTKQQGIWHFAGDVTVNVYSRIGGPYPDDPPSYSGPFDYRGEGLRGDQTISRGNKYLEDAYQNGDPVRFWRGSKGGPIEFLMWCAVVGRNWVRGTGVDDVDRRESAWKLHYVQRPEPEHWSREIADLRSLSRGDMNEPEAPEGSPNPTYEELLSRVASNPGGQPRRGAGRLTYGRREAARRAVLKRAGYKCESRCCTGMPRGVLRNGEPILEVDHIEELSQGGEDLPKNMVVLCPNCHASKTRGADSQRWVKELKAIAAAHHEEALHSK